MFRYVVVHRQFYDGHGYEDMLARMAKWNEFASLGPLA